MSKLHLLLNLGLTEADDPADPSGLAENNELGPEGLRAWTGEENTDLIGVVAILDLANFLENVVIDWP